MSERGEAEASDYLQHATVPSEGLSHSGGQKCYVEQREIINYTLDGSLSFKSKFKLFKACLTACNMLLLTEKH